MKSAQTVKVFQIKVTLKHIRPPVWRRILVPDDIRLSDLHGVLQLCMGWYNSHLHEFTIDHITFSDPSYDEFGTLDFEDESIVKLRDFHLREGSHFTYTYDFGDDWEHQLLIEKVLPFEKDMQLPYCVKGKRACPPEDVGGPWGYANFLEVMADPQREEHEELMEWIGGEFDPEAFDLETINNVFRLSSEMRWPASVPPLIWDQDDSQNSFFDPARWASLLAVDGQKIAQELALRQNVVAFLNYLKEHKVTGTKGPGNLTRKVMEDMAAHFVNPPPMEVTVGEDVVRFRSEEEVRPIYFVHMLAQGSGLVSGGPARRWSLTAAGETFLTLPPEGQVWVLFAGWWQRVHWEHALSYAGFGRLMLPENFPDQVIAHLRGIPVGKMVAFDLFMEELLQRMGAPWSLGEPNISQLSVNLTAEGTIIDPLEDFGVITGWHEVPPDPQFIYPVMVSFTRTAFGEALLDSVASSAG